MASELYKALAAAQAAVVGASKDAQNPFLAKKGRDGNLVEGTGMYVTLSAYIEAARPVLSANGLSVITMPSAAAAPDGYIGFTSTLAHSSGEFVIRDFFIPLVKKDAQGFGGTMTYARKYCLAAWLNMWAEDDDGESAVGRAGKPVSASPAAKPAPGRTVKELVEALTNAPSVAALDSLLPECQPYRDTKDWASIAAVAKSTKERLLKEAK